MAAPITSVCAPLLCAIVNGACCAVAVISTWLLPLLVGWVDEVALLCAAQLLFAIASAVVSSERVIWVLVAVHIEAWRELLIGGVLDAD